MDAELLMKCGCALLSNRTGRTPSVGTQTIDGKIPHNQPNLHGLPSGMDERTHLAITFKEKVVQTLYLLARFSFLL
jgi:hypothetical protein